MPSGTTRPRLLGDRSFRTYFLSAALGSLSHRTMAVAAPMVSVYVLRSSEFQIGVTTALSTVAVLVFGLPAGVWTDRMALKPLMIATGLVRAAAMSVIPILWAIGELTFWYLAASVFAVGALTVLYETARQSLLPVLVGRRRLVEGNAKIEGAAQISVLAAPSAGGELAARLGAPVAVLATAAGALASTLLLLGVRVEEDTGHRTENPDLRREIADGVRRVASSVALRAMALSDMVLHLCAAMYAAVHIVFIARTLHADPETTGLVLAMSAAGGVLGALAARRLSDRYGQGPTMVGGLAALPAAFLTVPAVHADWLVWAVGAGGAGVGFCTAVFAVTQVSARQQITPDSVLGRVNATFRVAGALAASVGALSGGAIAALWDTRTALCAAGAVALTACLPIAATPLRTRRSFAEEAVGGVPGKR
ncbi:MFS transporter [Salininema proteolyticum]|uniref:MFS transporter n=1 Tax=Salininema proteolyticum TaxID=1607685 RepID=A0ABV8TUY9_9ACTN